MSMMSVMNSAVAARAVLRRPIVQMVLFALLYAGAVLLGRATKIEGFELVMAWPAAGVATVWLMASPGRARRRWAVAVLAAVTAMMNWITGLELAASLGFGVGNVVHAVVAVVVLRQRGWTRVRQLTHVRDVVSLCWASLAAASASAVLGTALTAWRLDAPVLSSVGLLLPRNTLSTFIVASALLSLHPWWNGTARPEGSAGRGERWLLIAGTLLVAPSLLVLSDGGAPVGFLLLPITVVAAMRIGPGPTALLVFFQSALGAVQAMRGTGPWAVALSPTQVALFAQAFMAVLALVGLCLALAERERAEALLRAKNSRDQLQAHVDAALVGQAILVLAPDGLRVLSANPALAGLMGTSAKALAGLEWDRLIVPQDLARVNPHLRDVMAGGMSGWHGELRLLGADGTLWVDAAFGLVPGAPGTCISAQFVDVTARKQAEDQLSYLALHDELTGLPNRALWGQRLQQSLASGLRTGGQVGVMYVDIDHFKAINDSHGHETGDQVLVAVARRLRSAVRPQDTVARIGGDEFVVVCPDMLDEQGLRALGERTIDVLRAPVEAGGHQIVLSASIGITLSEPGDTDPALLLRHADLALYSAKGRGRSRVEIYNEQADGEADRQRCVLDDFAQALTGDELLLHYQPVVDIASGRITGLEALVRWRHPVKGLLAPGEWLDVIESSAFIHRLGDVVLEQACRDHAVLLAEGHGDLTMHVNVSARQLEQAGTAAKVERALQTSGVPARQLVLELTETRLLALHGSLLAELHAIRRLGVALAVDDFGTGYSTLAHLVEMPIDILKLDRSFVAGLGTRQSAHAISAGVLAMARGLGVSCVAEGVENLRQAELLAELGYTSAQGYLWAAPAPLEVTRRRLSTPQRLVSGTTTPDLPALSLG